MKGPALQNECVVVSGPRRFRDFRETGPRISIFYYFLGKITGHKHYRRPLANQIVYWPERLLWLRNQVNFPLHPPLEFILNVAMIILHIAASVTKVT